MRGVRERLEADAGDNGTRRDGAQMAPVRTRPKLLLDTLKDRIIGQPHALERIVPYVQMHRAGLAPDGRPVGVFLLLGPTGTGKTKTVEVLAEALHGSERSVLRVDCGEYQMEHEVAKLIGAPPGYLGHRETQPVLSQQKLSAVTSNDSNLSLVLFDEIEKAAPSLTRLLLGVLDKATLRLGDNSTVNFERSMIFLTSNLGWDAMQKTLKPDFGFEQFAAGEPVADSKLEALGMGAVKRRFPPEFVNRIDGVVTYRPLSKQSLETILDGLLKDLQNHLDKRLTERAPFLEVTKEARAYLIKEGTSLAYGARELKRLILRQITQPLAAMLDSGELEDGCNVRVESLKGGSGLTLVPR